MGCVNTSGVEASTKNPLGILAANEDVLRMIFKLLQPSGGLCAIATTCKSLRRSAMPVLFSHCEVLTRFLALEDVELFLPEVLWPYIQHLTFLGAFQKNFVFISNFEREPTMLAFPLRDVLPHLTQLRTVSFKSLEGSGIVLDALTAILSIPQLREFHSDGLLDPQEPMPETTSMAIAPLTSFRYADDDPWREVDRFSAFEHMVLSNIFTQARRTLVTLAIQAESAPYDLFPSEPWPALRELYLTGERTMIERLDVPIISVLGKMPHLQILSLALTLAGESTPQAIWPGGYDIEFPWPQLVSLTVSYPDPSDQLYSHLPSGLRRLAIRCYPRHYVHRILDHIFDCLDWVSPLPSSTTMLLILRQCKTPAITELDVEFKAAASESDDIALFHHISAAFPLITHLTVHRYRSSHETTMLIDGIAESLAPLSQLRILRISCDFPEEPYVFATPSNYGENEAAAYATLRDLVQRTADTFARVLSPSLEFVCILQRRRANNYWVPYHVVNDPETRVRHTVLDHQAALQDGVSVKDVPGPLPFVMR
ncbi:hypothetical protein C8Q78DRAFT_283779 [Trametes maxima]|nr:hypothetical protein C8Q78DRAFT_283779 [Trametes maxima]